MGTTVSTAPKAVDDKATTESTTTKISLDKLFQSLFDPPNTKNTTDLEPKVVSFDNIYPGTKSEETNVVLRNPEPNRVKKTDQTTEGVDTLRKEQGLWKVSCRFLCGSRKATGESLKKTDLQRNIISKLRQSRFVFFSPDCM